MERKIWNTQYGFRPGRSTTGEIHVTRRFQDDLESSGDPGVLCFLAWEKAFGKLKPKALVAPLRGNGAHPKLISIVRILYREAIFFVRPNGVVCSDHTQTTGTR